MRTHLINAPTDYVAFHLLELALCDECEACAGCKGACREGLWDHHSPCDCDDKEEPRG